jgi:hypothetical protein
LAAMSCIKKALGLPVTIGSRSTTPAAYKVSQRGAGSRMRKAYQPAAGVWCACRQRHDWFVSRCLCDGWQQHGTLAAREHSVVVVSNAAAAPTPATAAMLCTSTTAPGAAVVAATSVTFNKL